LGPAAQADLRISMQLALNIPSGRISGLAIVRIGVLGGTFNPIHSGHLHIARRIQRLFSLSQVHFVVATVPPHKPVENLISFSHRYAMVSLAVADTRSFIPSMIELEPEASPYSIDTMKKLSARIAGKNGTLYFIAGGDSLMEVKSWRDSERLLTSYNFVFAVRPGIDLARAKDALPERAVARVRDLRGLRRDEIRRKLAGSRANDNRIYIVDVKAPDISATRIRNLAFSGKAIDRMVPRPVRDYVGKLHLYGER
jgi:nicotinate-nucleotide adenylyltransferase